MEQEIIELKQKCIELQDKLDRIHYSIEMLKNTVRKGIDENIRKTNREPTPYIVKCHREALLVLRDIERELKKI